MKISHGLKLFLTSLLITACSKSDPQSDSFTDNSSSHQQLKNAKYSSEDEKKALSRFITGSEFCEKYKSVTSTENGFYVTVPVDYERPESGTTKIWAYFTSGPFNPEKPTMIYFDGGSGGNSHGGKKLLNDFNELHYDQRGIGCSHPESLDLYRDPNFYSNTNNARDAEEIRKSLKIDKLSLYGASYGTVVATTYASLFETNTRAVILDGTVFSDDPSSERIVGYYLKKMHAALPKGTQAGLKRYIDSEEQIANLWTLARILMYSNDPFGQMKKFLTLAFPSENEINQKLADTILGPDLHRQLFFGDEISSVEAFNNQVLNCKNGRQKHKIDVSLFGPTMGGAAYNVFHNYEYTVDRTKECETIHAKEDSILYSADLYPINLPVVYFQGNLDGATFASGAVKHYKKVPKKQKQLLIAVNGGHCPGIASLRSNNSDAIDLMETALLGKVISNDQLKKFNAVDPSVRWVYTSK